jgi:rare lipoprotein A
MVTRQLGFLVLASSLAISCADFAEAKNRSHHAKHSGTHTSGTSGMASIYASKGDGYAGKRTASGERAQSGALTAAHRSLPFGTKVQVTNRRNNKSVVVRINDRGPFVRGRVIDLTPAGARALGFSGLAPVTLSVVGKS